MLIAQMTYKMYFGGSIGNPGLQNIQIPAFINDKGELVIGHNGESKKHINPENYSEDIVSIFESFEFFCSHKYKGAKASTPQFLCNGNIPYELMEVTTKEGFTTKVLYTYLTPCRDGTYFCKCKKCSKNYVIDCYASSFFQGRLLTLPIIRCRECIQEHKKGDIK